jgi:predicted acylesterase/phospholipase RssA
MAKEKKRGLVMTGGGAKGLYEAGVIHAFHITGMEFDILTGSSIGAMNSIFFAEYLFQKRQLPETVQKEPEKTIEALNDLVMAYHHAWLQMPDRRLVDDSPDGPIGRLKDDLEHFNVGLPLLTKLGWWWTDPDRNAVPPPGSWPDMLKLVLELIKQFGGPGKLFNLLRNKPKNLVEAIARAYLGKFDMERSLVPPTDFTLKEIFTRPISPMRLEHLLGDASAPDAQGTRLYTLVSPERTLGDYYQKGIAVRVTRANFRTGRLEISAYVPVETFVRFMEKQAWRIEASGPEKLPLGSFRLLVPGNPNAINAGLSSGRFPGVFAPFPLKQVYLDKNPENTLLYKMLDGWLADAEVESQLRQAYFNLAPDQVRDGVKYNELYNRWRKPGSIRGFFPVKDDIYVDGGSIDNTPSNSAVDYIREWVEASNKSRHDVGLELFVIFLEEEPRVNAEEVNDPAIFQVVNRTLKIQGAAKKTSDANTVSTINTFGLRGESMGLALKALLESFQETLSGLAPDQQLQAQKRFYEKTKELAVRGYLGGSPDGILKRLDEWTADMLKNRMPLQVEAVKIFPMSMPMDTLQFTERLGYHKENAIKMLTSGCYDTLWAMRARLEEQTADDLDSQDRQTLELAKKWMGIERWPAAKPEQDQLRQDWNCRRTGCVYYAQHCDYGAKKRK